MTKLFKWIAGVATAIVALFFLTRSSQHRKKQDKIVDKIMEEQAQSGSALKKASAKQYKAESERLLAEAALKEGEARIEELEEKGHESLADRVRRRNERLRNRRGS